MTDYYTLIHGELTKKATTDNRFKILSVFYIFWTSPFLILATFINARHGNDDETKDYANMDKFEKFGFQASANLVSLIIWIVIVFASIKS